jgi:hypothetical protein
VVKVWLVDHAPKIGRRGWRGRITHVPSGRSLHFADMAEMTLFISSYLHQLGIKPTRWWTVRQWWRG